MPIRQDATLPGMSKSVTEKTQKPTRRGPARHFKWVGEPCISVYEYDNVLLREHCQIVHHPVSLGVRPDVMILGRNHCALISISSHFALAFVLHVLLYIFN